MASSSGASAGGASAGGASGGDTWHNIKTLKNRMSSVRERMQRRRAAAVSVSASAAASVAVDPAASEGGAKAGVSQPLSISLDLERAGMIELSREQHQTQALTKAALGRLLSDRCACSEELLTILLDKFSALGLIRVVDEVEFGILIRDIDRVKLQALLDSKPAQAAAEQPAGKAAVRGSSKRKRLGSDDARASAVPEKRGRGQSAPSGASSRRGPGSVQDELGELLAVSSHKEAENQKLGEEILGVLNTASTMEQSLASKFRSQSGSSVREFCEYCTAQDCMRARKSRRRCGKLHFKRIIKPHTDVSLGNCSFLNNCFRMETCKFIHYAVDDYQPPSAHRAAAAVLEPVSSGSAILTKYDLADMRTYPPQWVQCDVRYLDMHVLGEFSVIMADPPWDIHMELPYGTMEDSEMRKLPIPQLQSSGYIFLWVTGRAMELGRELLKLWNYKRCDELVWIKTNQLQKLIRTGRTGHWLNHGKEHCLVGVKGNPPCNRGLDCDVLVAEVRKTSHKPDEVYGLIERLSPGTRKLELFGRQHNVQKNWVTLGNQLQGVNLKDPELVTRFQERYPGDMETTQRMLLTGEDLSAAKPASSSSP